MPFDAKQRSPEARAEMVAKMGIQKIAYDWRQEHVAEFEREILAYQKYDIEFFAFGECTTTPSSFLRNTNCIHNSGSC